MADPEKLTALKKAYADTILNTAKEAAARVVVSERKARGYQQELVSVRDEALRTLLRLKQMFDSKVKEAETVSSSKQSKIDELEAQLGEAEDIVGELRMELRELHDELQKVTNGQTDLNNKENPCREDGGSEAGGSYEPVGEKIGSVAAANGIKNQSLSGMKSIRRCSCKDNEDGGHYTLPSILTRCRDAEMLKEEFNQMIHTLEQRIARVDLPASVNSDSVKSKGPSCKSSSNRSVETSHMSGYAATTADSPSSLRGNGEGQNPVFRNGSDTSTSLKTGPSARGSNGEPLIGKPCSGKEEEVNRERIEREESSPGSPFDRRFIKYTFKRKKRKKDDVSSPGRDSSLDESGGSNKSRKTGEKGNSYLELLKSGLMSGSSRDSQRVARVVRQLVPLSEKKGLLEK